MPTELISLGILFLCAIIGGIIAARFKQPAVFGLLLVGAVIGPNSLNLVKDMNMIQMMAEFGAILILFIIGLEFDVSKMMKLGARYILIGLLKFLIIMFLGYQITLLLGLGAKVALFVGVILSFSSTVVVVKVLEQKGMFNRKEIPLLIVVLIIEDVIAVLALTFFSGIKDSQSGLVQIFEHLLFSITILIVAYLVMMKILRYGVNIIMKNSKDDSVLTFLSLAIGALFSYFALALGLTPSAGAFLAGSLIASLPNSKEYGAAIQPYVLIFTSVFFIAMGTMVDFKSAKSNLMLIEILVITVIISRVLVIGLLTFLFANFKKEQPFFSSIAMMSVGEFSLLVAKESEKFGLGIDLVTITAVIIFITAVIMSIGINYSEKIYSAFNAKAPMKIRLKSERISDYFRRFFDQMEIEHFTTKKLRRDLKAALLMLGILVFGFFALRRLSFITISEYGQWTVYVFYAISAASLLYLSNLIYKRLKLIHVTLSSILTNVDSSRSLKKCTRILNNLFIAGGFLFIAMLFPFAMFVFNLSLWTDVLSFTLIVPGIYYLKKMIDLIDNERRFSNFERSFSAKPAAAKV